MPGALTEIINIQSQLLAMQVDLANLNQANTLYSNGSLISTATITTNLNSLLATVNTAVATASNNIINGNQ